MKTETLSGTAIVGGYVIDITGRHAAPKPGTVIWWRDYRHDPKQGGKWLPTGRPRKAVFVRFKERDTLDDKWEVSDWRCYRRGLHGCTFIGSKSLHRAEGLVGAITKGGVVVGRAERDRILGLWRAEPLNKDARLFPRESEAIAYVLNSAA